jgi:hypothetical protein
MLIKKIDWKNEKGEFIPYIIDMSNENVAALSAEEKTNAMLDFIRDSLDEQSISKDLYDNYSNLLGKDTSVVLRYLERQLRNFKRFPLLIFPFIQTVEDIKGYINYFYRSNWILYFESTDFGVVQYCERHHSATSKIPVKSLQVNPLKDVDGKIFVERRLAIVSQGKSSVEFDIKAINKYLETRKRSGGTSLREFELMCYRAYSEAIKSKKKLICFDDMAQAALSFLGYKNE